MEQRRERLFKEDFPQQKVEEMGVREKICIQNVHACMREK